MNAAHGVDAVAPGAGTLLQESKPALPPAPPQAPLGLTVEPLQRLDIPATTPFTVRQFRLSGNSVFATPVLDGLLKAEEGRSFTLSELTALVDRISDYYHAHGYPLARAIIPPQIIRDGIVQVAIIEARYGDVTIDNRSRVSTDLLRATAATLAAGQVIQQGELEHVLLLMSDIPGASQNATLQPGTNPGTSTLVIQETSVSPVIGQVNVDNDGNAFTGRARGGGEMAVYDPLGHGDVLDASLLTSGTGLQFGRLSYDVLLDGTGTRAGVAYAALHYVLGDSLNALEGHGTAQVASLWIRRPLVRTRDANLYAELEYDHKALDDNIDIDALRTHRHLNNGVARITGDWRDGVLSGGANNWNLQWTFGDLRFADAAAQRNDALTARTQGRFSQWNAAFSRTQRLTESTTAYLSLTAQTSGGNLDPSQQFTAGGRFSVRAYDTSVLSGDTGVLASIEVHRALVSDWHGQWQVLGFIEGERLTINRSVWTAGTNDATLGGGGCGIAWTRSKQWSARAYVASRLGPSSALISDAPLLRGWFEISKGFQ